MPFGALTVLRGYASTIVTTSTAVGLAHRGVTLHRGDKPFEAATLIRCRTGCIHTFHQATGPTQSIKCWALWLVAHVADTDLRGHTVSMLTWRIANGLTNMLRVLNKTIVRLAGADLRSTAAAVNASRTALRLTRLVGTHQVSGATGTDLRRKAISIETLRTALRLTLVTKFRWLVAWEALTLLWRHTASIGRAALLANGFTNIRFSLGVSHMAYALLGGLAGAMLPTCLAAHWFALALIRSGVAFPALTFSWRKAVAIWTTCWITNRNTLARLPKAIAFQTLTMSGLFAELMRTTAGLAHWLACCIEGLLLIADFAFTDIWLRAEAMLPALRRTMRHTISATLAIAKFAFTQIRCKAVGILAAFLADRTAGIASITCVAAAIKRRRAVTVLGTGSMANGPANAVG